MRRWTTPSTRFLPGAALGRRHPPRRQLLHGLRRRLRHPRRPDEGPEAPRQHPGQVRPGGRHDRPARRRQVRQGRLQGLRRPARRRHLRASTRSPSGSTSRSTATGKIWLQSYERGKPEPPSSPRARPRTTAPKVTFKPDARSSTATSSPTTSSPTACANWPS